MCFKGRIFVGGGGLPPGQELCTSSHHSLGLRFRVLAPCAALGSIHGGRGNRILRFYKNDASIGGHYIAEAEEGPVWFF